MLTLRVCFRGEQPLPVTECQPVHPQQPGPSGPLRECPPRRRHAGTNTHTQFLIHLRASINNT